MGAIGDIFLRAVADMAKFEVDLVKGAEKAGDKAGKTTGQRIAAGIGTAMKAGLGVIAGAAAFATKGLLELENVTADFRAETGATAEEAERAGDAILAMSRRNIQPIGEIGAALTKVHTDLGLTGDAAAETAERFLRFARATKQDAAAAVVDFDDILDAWGLTAEDAQHVMDNLVASHQEYGGSITDNQKSLANLAPQLRALNLDIDDGQALLNLFAASGLDASKAQFALNSAIQKMPPGETFDDVIVRLSAIEDPAVRAREAIELFGARGGAALANVLRPGIESLDDFALSEERIVDSSDEAAEALDSTFGARVQLMLKNFGGAILEAGKNFGPLTTGLASLASLAGALGLDKAFSKAWNALRGSAAVKAAAGAAGAAMGAVYRLAAVGAEHLTDAARGAWSAVAKSSAVRKAAGVSGAAVGAVFGVAAAGAGKIVEAFTALFVRLPFANALRGAVLAAAIKIGTLSGTTMGTTAATAFRAALIAGTVGLPILVLDEFRKQLQNPGGLIPTPWGSPDDLRDKLFPDQQTTGEAAQQYADDLVAETVASLDEQLPAIPGAVGDGLADGEPTVTSGAETMVSGVAGAVQNAASTAAAAAALTPGGIADAISSRRSAVDTAMAELAAAMENPMNTTKERAKIIGALTSTDLADALRSQDPYVKRRAQELQALLLQQLNALPLSTKTIGAEGEKALADGLNSKDPLVRAAAENVRAILDKKFKETANAGKVWGKSLGELYALGLRAAYASVKAAGNYVAGAAAGPLRPSSPPKEGPLHTIDKWPGDLMDIYARGIRATRPELARAFAYASGGMQPWAPAFAPQSAADRLASFAPSLAPRMAPSLAVGGGEGGGAFIQNNNLNVAGALPIETVRDTTSALRRIQETGQMRARRAPALYPLRPAHVRSTVVRDG